ncbi:hypothetical protein GCM10010214_44440 [Streptomyces abikoensis]|nr:hypothetical protein GCM10010214_44440 [Streptomyces abikoensis]
MPLFIEHRHDHGNGWQLLIGHGSSGVRGSGSPPGGRRKRRPRYRQWGTGFRPARVAEWARTAWGRRQIIVWAYVVSAWRGKRHTRPCPSPARRPIPAEVPQ